MLNKHAKKLIILILLSYTGITLLAHLVAPNFLFPVRRATYENTRPIIHFQTTTQHTLAALWVKSEQSPYVILYSHGNSTDIGMVSILMKHFKQHGFSVLAYDYSGYGHSTGQPSEKNTYNDIQAAYEYLIKVKHILAKHIILYGHSLGTGPTLHLAQNHTVAGIILEGGFVSAYQVFTHFNFIPFSPYQNLKLISKINAPILIIHAKKDRIIPIWHSKKLLKYAPQPKFYLWENNSGHNMHIFGYHRDYWQAINNFRAFLKGYAVQK